MEQATRRLRVLVVEDEPMILMDLGFALEDCGHDAVKATGVAGAMAAIAEAVPDVAILDVNLGGGTTCEPVAEALVAAGVPFLLHSGDLVRQGELIDRIGAEVIAKPSDSRTVAAQAALLANRKLSA